MRTKSIEIALNTGDHTRAMTEDENPITKLIQAMSSLQENAQSLGLEEMEVEELKENLMIPELFRARKKVLLGMLKELLEEEEKLYVPEPKQSYVLGSKRREGPGSCEKDDRAADARFTGLTKPLAKTGRTVER